MDVPRRPLTTFDPVCQTVLGLTMVYSRRSRVSGLGSRTRSPAMRGCKVYVPSNRLSLRPSAETSSCIGSCTLFPYRGTGANLD